mmetsp:Transcript_41551/g.62117  ORF Transcript_41551/g.62117 Transcript_41551/m.62117 type:complete len:89 (-) Transcript_41551:7-273(-)
MLNMFHAKVGDGADKCHGPGEEQKEHVELETLRRSPTDAAIHKHTGAGASKDLGEHCFREDSELETDSPFTLPPHSKLSFGLEASSFA